MITWQAETEANTGLLSLGAQRREAVIFYSSIASAKDSFVVIATDVHFYPSSDRSRRWDSKKKNPKIPQSVKTVVLIHCQYSFKSYFATMIFN